MDYIDWIFKYTVEEEYLKDMLSKGLVPEDKVKGVLCEIEIIRAAKEHAIIMLSEMTDI